jgi:ABC-type nitrate/sulfonate/bicarbonate transport system substrate-binding protein
MKITNFALIASVIMLMAGCGGETKPTSTSPNEAVTAVSGGNQKMPSFSVASSEYPSWSTLMVAAKAGLINGEKGGKPGVLEKKWNVDVVLEVKDYDPCLAMFANGAVDAVCMTNMDSLNPALGRPCTAICPTSTSVGADKVIAVGYKTPEELKGQKVFGLAKSVSQYSYVRELKKRGLNPAEYPFENLDPAAAATALQSSSGEIKAICVWNPYALQTLRTNPRSTTICDSSEIPEEIIDMIVMGNDSLKKEGGENFAALLCDTYYAVCDKLNDSDQKVADATLTAIGEDFSKLPLDDMRIVVKETRFYDTPAKGKALFTSAAYKETMKIVVDTCVEIGVLENTLPSIGYNDEGKQLNFSTKYMEMAASKK